MSIEADMTARMKDAMRARDKRLLGVIRMIKSRVQEAKTAAGFDGDDGDGLWQAVIEAYAKSQKKARAQFVDVGEAGAHHVEQIDYELSVLDEWLPKKADEATVRGWVDEAIAGLGGKERAKFGQVMGVVMKAHKADVEPAMVRDLVKRALG